MLARGDAAEVLTPGTHASTFGGNPVCCAAGLAVLGELLDGGLLERVNVLGGVFRQGLEGIAGRQGAAVSVRGRGLLLGLELAVEAKPVVAEAMAKGYLINAAQEKVLRFAPPFVITEEEIAGFLADLESILSGPG